MEIILKLELEGQAGTCQEARTETGQVHGKNRPRHQKKVMSGETRKVKRFWGVMLKCVVFVLREKKKSLTFLK